MHFKGTAHRYGRDIDTDVIIPARYLNSSEPEWLAQHCLEDLDADFVKKVKKGDIIVAEENFGCGSSREHAPIAIKAAGVDVVYFGGLHPEAGLIVRQMRDQGVKAVLFSGDGITDKEFWTIAGPGAEGTLMTFGPDPRENPAAKEIVAKFKAKGVDPEGYVLYSYAAVQVIKQAAEAIKSLDPKKVAQEIQSGKTFETVLGPLAFDKNGDITKLDYVVYVWKNGDYTQL